MGRFRNFFVAFLGIHILATTTSAPESSPAILSGAGAPAMIAPRGSIYLRTDPNSATVVYVNFLGTAAGWKLAVEPDVIADPGDATAIPVTKSGTIAITTAAAETNTLAIPTFAGQRLSLICDVYAVGDRVITAAQPINATGDTIMTFGAAGDYIVLEAAQLAGALVWRVVGNDGVALS